MLDNAKGPRYERLIGAKLRLNMNERPLPLSQSASPLEDR